MSSVSASPAMACALLAVARSSLGDNRSGPRNLDSGLSEISIVFQAAVPKPVVPKHTTSGSADQVNYDAVA